MDDEVRDRIMPGCLMNVVRDVISTIPSKTNSAIFMNHGKTDGLFSTTVWEHSLSRPVKQSMKQLII